MTVTASVLRSSALSSAAKFISKLIGVSSTMLLARILAPEQFGFIAIISMTLYFFDVFSSVAAEQYIIQKRSVSQNDMNTAWSFNLLLKSIIALILIAVAEPAALFLNKPEVINAIRVSAIILPLSALKSPAIILLKRQLKYLGLFWFALFEKIASFIVVIYLALQWQNFWAFVVADIVATIVGVVLSYLWLGHSPNFSLVKLNKQWAFSKWMLAKNIVGYMRSQIDTVFVSRYFSNLALGQYHMSREVAMLPGHYLLAPAIEPLLAAFKNDKLRPAAMLDNASFSLIIVSLLTFPICAYFIVFSETVILFLLGQQWAVAAAMLPILSFLFVYWSLLQVLEALLVAQGRVRFLFCFDLVSLFILIVGLIWALNNQVAITELATIRVVIGCVSTFMLMVFLTRRDILQLSRVLLWMIAISGAVALSVSVSQRITSLFDFNLHEVTDLLGMIFISVATFGTVLAILSAAVLTMKPIDHNHRRLKSLVKTQCKDLFNK